MAKKTLASPPKPIPHPGEVVKRDCLEALGLTVAKTAEVLEVNRSLLSSLIHGHCDLTPDMAVRLAQVFGGSAEAWLQMQFDYDLAQAKAKAAVIRLKRYRQDDRTGGNSA